MGILEFWSGLKGLSGNPSGAVLGFPDEVSGVPDSSQLVHWRYLGSGPTDMRLNTDALILHD